jgi:hypothetical protein
MAAVQGYEVAASSGQEFDPCRLVRQVKEFEG